MSTATASAATPCSPAASPSAARRCRWPSSISRAVGADGPLAEQLQGFSWLRDLAAAASREKGARLAEALVGRWLLAHGTRVDEAWAPASVGRAHPVLDGLCALHPVERATPAIARPCSTRWRAAPATSTPTPTRRPPGLKRITAWCGVVAAGLLVQGGVPRVARGEAGLARALAAAQFDDGGLVSRSPFEQVLLVDRLGLLRACYFAAKQTMPDGDRGRRRRRAGRASRRHHGRRRAVELAGLQSRRGGAADRPDRRLRPARPAAAPGARLGLSAAVGARHDPRARRRAAAAAEDGRQRLASTLAFEMSDGAQRLVVNCGGPGPLPTELVRPSWSRGCARPRRTARWCSPTPIRPTSWPTARSAKASRTSPIERSEDNDASRLEASHDGYVRAFGLVHKRSLMLGNDGKELRGADQLIAQGPQEDPRVRPLMRCASTSRRGSRSRDGRRHGRDPPLEGRAAVELPLPRRQC